MTKPPASAIKFFSVACLTLALASAGLAALWPAALAAARQQSDQLTTEGNHAAGNEAEVDYRLATWLNSANPAAFAGLARTQIAGGHADDALISLEKAGEGSDVQQLKVRTLIELGRYNQAAEAADQLTLPGRTESDIELAALAYALSGRATDIEALTPRLSSPEALERVKRIQAGKQTLAAELYATGLLQSSSALLLTLPDTYERNLLLARIRYARHSPAELEQAATYLTTATVQTPSTLEARELLVKIYTDQNKPTEAAKQTELISKIQSGRP